MTEPRGNDRAAADEGVGPDAGASDSARDPRAASPRWGDRWREVLDTAPAGDARHVQRGRGLARRGAVEDLRIESGSVTAAVAEDRLDPRRVRLGWPVPDERRWEHAVEALRAELRFLATLLDRGLSDELATELARSGIALVPTLEVLEMQCDGPTCDGLCPHVAAVYTTVAVRIDRDPMVLLELRGRDVDRLLRELRGDVHDSLGSAAVDLSRGLAGAHGDLDAIELRPAPVDDPASLLLHLGEPPGVDDLEPLAAIIERAAAGAWRLAAGEGADAADEELLLAELRGQRVASAASLADALGREVDAVRNQLDALFAQGTVLRTGSGARARYRAAS